MNEESGDAYAATLEGAVLNQLRVDTTVAGVVDILAMVSLCCWLLP